MAENRALYWSEHIGAQQYRLRIRNNRPNGQKQWFVFDSRTHTIRPASNQKLAISIQDGGIDWNHSGYAAVVKPYKPSLLARLRWYAGGVQNIRDVGTRCLDVYGGSNVHKQHVIWWACHNGANQAWFLDDKGYTFPKFPVATGTKFQIKSKMAENRALFIAEDIGGAQYRLRIRDNHPGDNKQWFFFDSRTNTIRSWIQKDLVLANQKGKGF